MGDPRDSETGWQSRTTATGQRSARAERRRTARIVEEAREVWVPCGYCAGQRKLLVRATTAFEGRVHRGWSWVVCPRCGGMGDVLG